MTKLTNYIDTCLEMALAQGANSSNNTVLRVKQDVCIVVSHAEPTDLIFPLDGLWIVADPSSPRYKQMLKRSSKTASGSDTYTWNQMTDFDAAMAPQSWDDTDLPEPVIISGVGGELSGPLVPHAGPYDENEVAPRSELTSEITKLRSNFFTMYQNMNNRVLNVDSRIRSAEVEISEMSNRLSAVEMQSNSIVSKTFIKDEPSPVWYLNHNADTELVYVLVLTDHGEIVCPDVVGPAPEDSRNSTKVVFGGPVSGLAFALLMLDTPTPPNP